MRHARVFVSLFMLASMAVHPSFAGDGVTLSDRKHPVTWQGGPLSGTVPAPEACAAGGCDETTLSVGITGDPKGSLQIGIRWVGEDQDLDLYVYGPDGSLAASSVGILSTAEVVNLPAGNGAYRVLVVPNGATDVSFDGRAEIEPAPKTKPVRELLPDLTTLRVRNLHFETSAYLFDLPVPSMPGGCYPEEALEQGARRCLRFDQILANLGDGPFEIRYHLEGLGASQPLTQRIYRSDGTFRERYADRYTFHPAHAHFHYEDFAQSRLWASNAAGERLGSAPVRVGRKNGFCMVDVEDAWFDRRGDAPRTYVPPGCLAPSEADPEDGSVTALSGISVGWADVYNWFLADQFIEVSGLPDGDYLLESIAAPEGTIEETDTTNNSSFTHIRICRDAAEVVGVGLPVCPN